jgi:predicted amidohydrolase YtcJ
MANTPSVATPPAFADLLIVNASIWSPGGMLPHTALAAKDGVITALGDDTLREQVTATETFDAQGGLVTPGFVDAHVHAIFGGVESNRCDISACETLEEAEAVILKYAAEHPDAPWILGGGWSMPWFPGGTPHRRDLDRLVADRPAFLLNADHHGAWANSRALELAGITSDTRDPDDGRIERDADGSPSGTLHEGATELLDGVMPATDAAELRTGLLDAEALLLSHGIVGWQDAILGEYGGYPDITSTYTDAVDEGALRARVSGALWVARDFGGRDIEGFVADLVRRRDQYAREGLRLHTAKIMVDGVAENETAAMHESYRSDATDCKCARGTGLAYFSRAELLTLVPLLNEAGFDAHFHAIGDRAVTYALDAVAAVAPHIRDARRNHIAHLQVVRPADISRFSELGVTANMQMLWACRDEQMVDLTLGLLGPERAEWQYPFASLQRLGTQLACGSDWPVSTPNPWLAIHVAVTRQVPQSDTEPLLAHEAISLEHALTAYTHGSHSLLGFPGGRIEVGAVCDLAIADRNPYEVSAEQIFATTNVATVLRGEVVYR